MTPKEKADELVDKYYTMVEAPFDDNAKQCALIAVDLVIENIEDDYIGKELEYWTDVKNEIERL